MAAVASLLNESSTTISSAQRTESRHAPSVRSLLKLVMHTESFSIEVPARITRTPALRGRAPIMQYFRVELRGLVGHARQGEFLRGVVPGGLHGRARRCRLMQHLVDRGGERRRRSVVNQELRRHNIERARHARCGPSPTITSGAGT